MGRIRHLVGLIVLAAICLQGCSATEKQIRPPKPPEEYNAPPEEPRYIGPIQYPAETMDQDILLKRAKDSAKDKNGPPGMRGTSGPGGRMPGT